MKCLENLPELMEKLKIARDEKNKIIEEIHIFLAEHYDNLPTYCKRYGTDVQTNYFYNPNIDNDDYTGYKAIMIDESYFLLVEHNQYIIPTLFDDLDGNEKYHAYGHIYRKAYRDALGFFINTLEDNIKAEIEEIKKEFI